MHYVLTSVEKIHVRGKPCFFKVPYSRQYAYMYPYGYKCSTLSLDAKEKEENPQAKEKLHLEDGD